MAPDGKGKPTRGISLSAAAAVFSAVIAAGGIFLAVNQNVAANHQNTLADRQSLTMLVAEITRVVNAKAKAEAEHAGEEQALLEQTLLSDGEQALSVSEALHQSVPPVDSFEIGNAFSNAVEYPKALAAYKRAIGPGAGPRIRANTLREEARIHYLLRGPVNLAVAREDIHLAYAAYAGQPDVPQELIAHDHAYTDLFNAEQTAPIDCQETHKELARAKEVIHGEPAIREAMRELLEGAEYATARCSKRAPHQPLILRRVPAPPELRTIKKPIERAPSG